MTLWWMLLVAMVSLTLGILLGLAHGSTDLPCLKYNDGKVAVILSHDIVISVSGVRSVTEYCEGWTDTIHFFKMNGYHIAAATDFEVYMERN